MEEERELMMIQVEDRGEVCRLKELYVIFLLCYFRKMS
jgi:hypothetical protein